MEQLQLVGIDQVLPHYPYVEVPSQPLSCENTQCGVQFSMVRVGATGKGGGARTPIQRTDSWQLPRSS